MTGEPQAVPFWVDLVIVGTGLAGAWLNAKGRAAGFYVWMITNALLMATYLWPVPNVRALLFAAYFAFCVVGARRWKRVPPTVTADGR